ncbi:unnamed protein product [Phytomonas sp. EM1]|nr:unnamed protein product [Phytomonas sp. EM1]|eukprot:CCW62470.1 unnamed protein product [Phytomonas sp. isolate EM1]
MSLHDKLFADVCRIVDESYVSLFFLLTGQRGGGKSFVLRSLFTSLIDTRAASEVDTLSNLLVHNSSDSEDKNAFRVCRVDYNMLLSWSRQLKAEQDLKFLSFPPLTVLIVDDVHALFELCSLNRVSRFMEKLLLCALHSSGCALVASALSENDVPSCLLQCRRPIIYSISSNLHYPGKSFPFEADANFPQLKCIAPEAVLDMSFRDTLIALCMTKLAFQSHGDGASALDDEPSAMIRRHLKWLSGSLGDQKSARVDNLYGLEHIWTRLSILISVFASLKEPGISGKLLASLPTTTGILLHGPSGCGKSALVRHIAAAFPSVAFHFVECTKLFSKYLGESEEKLREVYCKARLRTPSVVVLDNLDVIAQSRGAMQGSDTSGGGSGVDVNRRMLACLLCELDGVTSNSGVLTIGTTNAPHVMDKALLRRGRLESVILVPPLTLQAAQGMCHRFFDSFEMEPTERSACIEAVAKASEGCSPVALRFVLRKLLEKLLPHISASRKSLVLSVQMSVEDILFENASLLAPIDYPFVQF